MKNVLLRLVAGTLSISSVCAVLSASMPVQAEPSTTQVYANDFESGDVSAFTGRGGVETIEVTENGHTGKAMKVANREKNWNGPQYLLDPSVFENGVEYTVSAYVASEWYNNINLSMEYTDEAGERHYNNLSSKVSQGASDWQQFESVKFSLNSSMSKVYLYFEGSETAPLYIDDFEIRTAPVYDIQEDIPSLKDVYSPYFKFGTACTASELAPKSAQNLIKKHFNSITAGNELKPDAILDQAASQAAGTPKVSLASARSILNFARDNGLSVRGHVLVWHQQTPEWFFKEGFETSGAWLSKEAMLERMEQYIKAVFDAVKTEYPDVDFYAWDVVNECYLDDGSHRDPGTQAEGSAKSPWVKIFGDNSFIPYAFEYARKYAPEGCKLYYNDFNEYMPGKTDAIVAMATELKAKGLIDGIGMQSHLDITFPGISAYKKALEKFAATGLDIQVTELDATTSDTSEAGFAAQAQYYSDIMDAIMEYKDSISAVVVWGTTDDKSWRAAKYPLLFNEDFTAKPAYYSIIDGLETPVVTTTEPQQTTTAETQTTTMPTTVVTEEEQKQWSAMIEVKKLPKTEYVVGDTLDLTGLKALMRFVGDNGAYRMLDDSDEYLDPQERDDAFIIDTSAVDMSKPGDYMIYLAPTQAVLDQYEASFISNGANEFMICVRDPALTTTVAGTTETPFDTTTTVSTLQSSVTNILNTTTVTALQSSVTVTSIGTDHDTIETFYGDVNLDQVIDITDAVLLNKINADTVQPNPQMRANADVNNDSELSAKDAITLLRFIVGAVKELPFSE